MKFLIMVFMVFMLVFCGTVLGILAVKGELSGDLINKLMGKTPPPAASPDGQQPAGGGPGQPQLSGFDKMAKDLEDQKRQFEEEKAKAAEDAGRVKLAGDDLKKMASDLTKRLDEFQNTQQQETTSQNEGLKSTAETVGKMKPKGAAEALAKSLNQAAKILQYVPEKQRAKILDAMKPEDVQLIIQDLTRLGVPTDSTAPGAAPAK